MYTKENLIKDITAIIWVVALMVVGVLTIEILEL